MATKIGNNHKEYFDNCRFQGVNSQQKDKTKTANILLWKYIEQAITIKPRIVEKTLFLILHSLAMDMITAPTENAAIARVARAYENVIIKPAKIRNNVW